MKTQSLLFLTAIGAAIALPSTIVDFETDTMDIEQEGQAGKAVEGEYSWVAPNGQEVSVKYVADDRGFRVLENENTIAGGSEFDFDSAGRIKPFGIEEVAEIPEAIEVVPVEVDPAEEVPAEEEEEEEEEKEEEEEEEEEEEDDD